MHPGTTMTDQPLDASAAPFRWRNRYADVATWRHAQTARLLPPDVVLPSVANLQPKSLSLERVTILALSSFRPISKKF